MGQAGCPGREPDCLKPVGTWLGVSARMYNASGNYTCNIMSFNFKRHDNTYKILKRHNHVFKNCMTFLCHEY